MISTFILPFFLYHNLYENTNTIAPKKYRHISFKRSLFSKLDLMTQIFLRSQRAWKSYRALKNAPILFKATVDITSFDSMIASARKITKRIGEYVIKEAKSDKSMGRPGGERTLSQWLPGNRFCLFCILAAILRSREIKRVNLATSNA